jgi:drug/metabolite transporter superfamily protein YnfA
MIIKYKEILYSLFFFFLAGLCEIGGGYLVWLWLRESYSWIFGVFGGFILFLYGVIPTFQKSHFHRTYAAYGGIFIVMAIILNSFISIFNSHILDLKVTNSISMNKEMGRNRIILKDNILL